MLDESIRSQLREHLKRVQRPVEILAELDAGEASGRVRELLQELAELSPELSWREGSVSATRLPTFAVGQPGAIGRMRFCGLPMGHEFSSLILALLHAGGHPPRVDPELRAQIEALPGEHHFETFVSLSCQTCPGVVQALNLFAALNQGITHTMIDGAVFAEEVEKRNLLAVPMVFRGDDLFAQGAVSEAQILEKLDARAAQRKGEALSRKAPFDVLVLGGGPAGAAAAIYAARKGIRTGIVAERFGGQLMDTASIENFISVREIQGPELTRQLEEHVREYDVDIMLDQRADGLVDAEQSPDGLVHLSFESGGMLRSRVVILAPGARWRSLGVPGEDEYRNRGVAYCPHCDGPLFKGKRVAVIGGGNSGVEAAIDLAGLTEHVTLLEFEDSLLADAVLQERARSLPNVTIIESAQTTAILGDGERVESLEYTDRGSGEEHSLPLDGVFVQIGLVANTEWLAGSRVELSPYGEIEVDERGRTSAPGVFAAGDATTAPTKQIVIAMGDGANAALGAFDSLLRTPVLAEPKEAPEPADQVTAA
jgi:alkyl hydroperoxide reductase subunit F